MNIPRRLFLAGGLALALAFVAFPVGSSYAATLLEIYEIAKGDVESGLLRKKVSAAAFIKAEDILGEATPSATRLAWALSALQNPVGESLALFHYVLAANDSATQSQILNAADSAIQTNIDSAVDALYP